MKSIHVNSADQAFDVLRAESRTLELGDMTVVGIWPGKMMKALVAITMALHQSCDALPDSIAGKSKETCLFCSLAVRDFLVAIGFHDATVRPCGLVMRASDRQYGELHSLGIGIPGEPDIEGKFNGHAVVIVPHLSLFIDTTLYQAIRPQWGGALTGMFAGQYRAPENWKVYDRHPFAGFEVALPNGHFQLCWLDRPELRWKDALDYRVKSARRRAVTKALVKAFGVWRD